MNLGRWMRRRAEFGLSASIAVLMLAGCGAAAPVAPPSLEDNGPDRPPAGGPELIVDGQPLAAPVVLDEVPAGLRVWGVDYNPSDDRPPAHRITLYGDPSFADTLDGRLVLVGSSSGSASLGGPPGGAADGESVDLGGKDGFLIRSGELTWIGIPGNDSVEFVVGRGVGDEELIRAAAGAQFGAVTATIAADSVPAGLEPLIAAGGRDGPGGGARESIALEVLDGSQSRVIVSIARADPRLAAVWGFWTGDPGGTMIRGQPGSAGDLVGTGHDEEVEPGRVWAEAGMVFVARARGSAVPYLDDVVNSLRAGTEAELESMRAATLERAPTAEEIGCPPGALVVSAVQGDLRWVFGVGTFPGNQVETSESCSALVTGAGTIGGGIGSFNLAPLGRLSVNVSSGSGPGVPDGTTLAGVAPPGTARVTITGPDGVVVDAVLSVHGPRPGERLFGQFFPGDVAAFVGPFTVTAFDATGAVLGTVTT